MDLHALIEGFDNIVFCFTQSVSDTFSTEDIYRRQEFHDYLPLENTGLERCAEPVDQMIYQEYSDKDSTIDDFLPQSCKLRAVILDVSSAETSTVEQTESHKSNHERELYWKELIDHLYCEQFASQWSLVHGFRFFQLSLLGCYSP